MLLTYLSLLHPIIISISAHNHVIRSLSCILGGAYLHIGSFIHGSNSLMVIYQIYFLHLKNQNVCHILDLFTTSLYRNIVLVKFLIWSFKHVMILSWSIVMIALTFLTVVIFLCQMVNPAYYGLDDTQPEIVSSYLSRWFLIKCD